MSNNPLRACIRHALRNPATIAGTCVTLASLANGAAAQSADTADQKNQSLETIVVTGSNIRRVDMETANPVLTIDHAAIQASGKLTLGDLVQSLPSIAGAATNPNVNNGGGDGRSTISLRGLGTARSLLLINGHRIPGQLQDLNIIPASAVERIEVLTDGSSAVYGSDAVAGVVNIITRTNYQGAEFGADYGISDRDDGQRKAYHVMFGQSTDKGSIILGLNYNKNDSVLAANRAYSHDALYKYSNGYVLHGGSSRTPGGYIVLPSGNPIATQLGCGTVTRIAGAAGTSPNDFRCYKPTDAFNFQAVGNYDATPGERTGLFALGNYKLTDNIEAFIEVFHNKTVSRTQIAPVPTDALADGIYIPSTAYYNPFGVDFGLNPTTGEATNQFRTRLQALGNRAGNFSTTHDLATFGFKGSIPDSSWTWFVDGSYGKKSQQIQSIDFLNYSALAAGLACSTAPGAGTCDPINFFNLTSPGTLTALKAAQISPFIHNTYQMKTAEAGVSGSLFSLPAGDIQLAAGASYRKEYVDDQVDSIITYTPTFNTDGSLANLLCSGPNSICSANTQGGFNVKEAYAELLIPLLKDMPFVHSLNLDIGDRYSKYSNFGSTSNWKIAIEFKPIEDLLIRGTVSKVFRAPTVSDLFGGATGDAPTAKDPLNPNSGTSQLSGIVAGSGFGNNILRTGIPILPEFGKSFDYGFVYDPSWLPGLSVNADYYRILLNNLIVSGPGTAQTIIDDCYLDGTTPVGPTCPLISRFTSGSSAGTIKFVYETPFNSGDLVTQGADIGAHYRLPETAFGNFTLNASATYIQKYDITDGGRTQGYAGKFDKTYGNLARWRGLAGVDWSWGALSASYQARYIGKVSIGYNEPGLGPSANANQTPAGDGTPAYNQSPYKYGSYVYQNIAIGYNIEALNTMIQVGVDNIADKQPPIFYLQNVVNGNTDVNTYDTIGRFFWGKITVKF